MFYHTISQQTLSCKHPGPWKDAYGSPEWNISQPHQNSNEPWTCMGLWLWIYQTSIPHKSLIFSEEIKRQIEKEKYFLWGEILSLKSVKAVVKVIISTSHRPQQQPEYGSKKSAIALGNLWYHLMDFLLNSRKGKEWKLPLFQSLGSSSLFEISCQSYFSTRLQVKSCSRNLPSASQHTRLTHSRDQKFPAFASSHTPAWSFHKTLSEYTASVWWSSLLSVAQSGRVTTLLCVLSSPLPSWFHFHHLTHHTASYSHATGSHGILAIVSILISFSVGGYRDKKNRSHLFFTASGSWSYKKGPSPVAIASTPMQTLWVDYAVHSVV